MNRITGIGACVYDTLIRVPHYPEEDTKLRAWDVVSAGVARSLPAWSLQLS